MFETICALAEKRKRENTPKGLSVVVAVLCCIVVTLSVFNVFATYDKTTAQTALQQESEELQVFAQDNYFDILLNIIRFSSTYQFLRIPFPYLDSDIWYRVLVPNAPYFSDLKHDTVLYKAMPYARVH